MSEKKKIMRLELRSNSASHLEIAVLLKCWSCASMEYSDIMYINRRLTCCNSSTRGSHPGIKGSNHRHQQDQSML